MSESLEARVRRVAADVFNLPFENVTRDTSPQTVESWDSVQHLNLVLALEQELGVSIDPEEIDKLQSVGAVIDLMARKTAT